MAGLSVFAFGENLLLVAVAIARREQAHTMLSTAWGFLPLPQLSSITPAMAYIGDSQAGTTHPHGCIHALWF